MLDKNLQKGRSMIEMIAVLAIIGIITVGAIAGVNQGFVKYRTSKTFTEINAINQGVYGMYKYFRKYPSTTSLDMNEACNSKVFPSGCENDNASALNPFGGNYTVQFGRIADDGAFVSATSAELMRICAGSIPAAACQELQNMTWGGYSRTDGDCIKDNDNPGIETFCIVFQ